MSPTGTPHENYTRADAEQAIADAEAIIQFRHRTLSS